MTITYTWTIPNMKCEDADNDGDCSTIKNIDWTLTGTDGVNTSTVSDSMPANILMAGMESEPDELWPTLTEAEIIVEVQGALGAERVRLLCDDITNDLYTKSLLNATLPWVV